MTLKVILMKFIFQNVFTILVNIESLAMHARTHTQIILNFSKIHLASCHVTSDNQCYNFYVHIFQGQKKKKF